MSSPAEIDPRWIPPVTVPDEDGPVPDLDVYEATLRRKQRMFANLRALFESQAWQEILIDDLVTKDLDRVDREMRKTVDHAAWNLLRGQRLILEWLTELPGFTERQEQLVKRKLDEIEKLKGGSSGE